MKTKSQPEASKFIPESTRTKRPEKGSETRKKAR
jgi:hypothetical protein